LPFLAVDLDGKKRFPMVARAIGCSVGDVAWGFLELWELCWQRKVAIVTPVALAGCFGRNDCAAALLEFGFLASVDGGFRVLGAEKYLRIAAAQKASAERTNSVRKPRSTVRSTARSTVRSKDGLTPNTQHPTPNTVKEDPPVPTAHQQTIDRLWASWLRIKRTPYVAVPRGADFKAVKELLAAGMSPEAIDSAWVRALQHSGFPTISSVAELHQHVGKFVGATPIGKGPVDPATQVFTVDGEVQW
jgi:hypothetical protein